MFIAILGWWLASPYLGVIHDSIFYTADALRHLHPENFQADPFFLKGTQGNYSIFGGIYARMIAWVGVKEGAWLTTVMGRACWLGAAWYLARMLGRPRWGMMLAAMLVLPSNYDGNHVFAYAEQFATPRIWAETLVMLSVANQVRGRTMTAWTLALGAACLHPLMALPGLALLTGLLRPRHRSALLLGSALIVLILASMHVAPFDGLLQRYDPQWWSVVRVRNADVLVQNWDAASLIRALGWVAILFWLSFRLDDPALRRLTRALSVVLLAALTVWCLASYSRNVLLLQLQVWRALWLAQLLAPALWLLTLKRPRDWTFQQWAHAMLMMCAFLSVLWPFALMFLAAFLVLHARAGNVLESPISRRMLIVGCALLLVADLLLRAQGTIIAWKFYDYYDASLPFGAALCSEPVVLGSAMLLVHSLIGCSKIRGRILVLASMTAMVAGVGASLFLDGRAALKPAVDLSAVRAIIPPTATVYWEGADANDTWLNLNRSHYASDWQGAGALFSRPSALLLKQRWGNLARAKLSRGNSIADGDKQRLLPVPELSNVINICRDRDLDFVILNGFRAGASRVVELPNRGAVSLYDCGRLRQAASRSRAPA